LLDLLEQLFECRQSGERLQVRFGLEFVSHHKLWVELDGFLQSCDRLSRPSKLGKRARSLKMRIGVLGLNLDCSVG
jgi:hypothetical protein